MVGQHPLAQAVHQTDRHVGAHVGQNELFFQLVVQIVVDLRTGKGVEDAAPKTGAGLLQTVL